MNGGYNWDNGGVNGGNIRTTGMNYQNQGMANQNFQNGVQNVNVNNMQRSYIPGRAVNSSDEVKAFEVPMESPISIFPKNDLSEIYVKYWGSDGMIKDIIFTRQLTPNQNSSSENSAMNDILSRLERIESMLKKRKNYYHKPRTNQSEKED